MSNRIKGRKTRFTCHLQVIRHGTIAFIYFSFSYVTKIHIYIKKPLKCLNYQGILKFKGSGYPQDPPPL